LESQDPIIIGYVLNRYVKRSGLLAKEVGAVIGREDEVILGKAKDDPVSYHFAFVVAPRRVPGGTGVHL
jgi:hypothetical protein